MVLILGRQLDLPLVHMGVAPLKIIALYQSVLRFGPTAFNTSVRAYSGLGRHLLSSQHLAERRERSQEAGSCRVYLMSAAVCGAGSSRSSDGASSDAPQEGATVTQHQAAGLYVVSVALLELGASN